MGYFDDQVRHRIELEDESFAEAYRKLYEVVSGNDVWENFGSKRILNRDVMKELARCLNVDCPRSYGQSMSQNEYLEKIFRPQGIMWREVALKDKWYENTIGIMLGALKDGRATVLLPSEWRGVYTYRNPDTGKRERVTAANVALFAEDALVMYRSFPERAIDDQDVQRFVLKSLSSRDINTYFGATFAATILSMVYPAVVRRLMGNYDALMGGFFVLLAVIGATFLFALIKQSMLPRIAQEVTIPLQAAFMMRLLSAPMRAVKDFSAGDLGSRIGGMFMLLRRIIVILLSLILAAVCSFVCFIQMFAISAPLAIIALIGTLIIARLFYKLVMQQSKINERKLKADAEESGITYSLIEGIQKVSLTNSEKRAFARWADVYKESAYSLYNPPFLLKTYTVLIPAILLVGTMIIYYHAARVQISQSDFFAFSSSLAIVTTALLAVPGGLMALSTISPLMKQLHPLMEMTPEVTSDKEIVEKLKGRIQVSNLTFRYESEGEPIIDDLSLDIKAGQYVAIVGSTGCGKSTLLKLLLGFETPEKGEISYDGHSLNTLNVSSLRRHIGTVMQNPDVMQGTIFDNIAIANASITLEDAWEAARIAGIAEDIEKMPLKMNTPLASRGRGISGGQKQRLMIARAVAAKPSIIFFDEATSALDNITQKVVTDAVGELACTRVVIAHRLSTVQNCDKIYCLDKGHIVEEGSFDELIAKDGFFAELVRRQQI